MPTKTKKRPTSCAIKTSAKIANKSVYVREDNLIQVGARGDGVEVGALYGAMTKSEARKLRKSLHKDGFVGYAMIARDSSENW